MASLKFDLHLHYFTEPSKENIATVPNKNRVTKAKKKEKCRRQKGATMARQSV